MKSKMILMSFSPLLRIFMMPISLRIHSSLTRWGIRGVKEWLIILSLVGELETIVSLSILLYLVGSSFSFDQCQPILFLLNFPSLAIRMHRNAFRQIRDNHPLGLYHAFSRLYDCQWWRRALWTQRSPTSRSQSITLEVAQETNENSYLEERGIIPRLDISPRFRSLIDFPFPSS